MTKQLIDIGVQGNDGTGDSIRDSFRKVNENFNELYAIFGIDGAIKFSNLQDGCNYGAGQFILGNDTGSTLIAKSLFPGAGLQITSSDTALTISLTGDAKLVNDLSPELGESLNAAGFTIGRLPNPSQALVDAFNAKYDIPTTLNELPVTVGFANINFVRLTADGVVGIPDENGVIIPGPVKARSEPELPDLTNPAYDPTLSGNYLSNEVLPRIDAVYRGGDTMRGPLYLNDHPKELAGTIGSSSTDDLQAATAFYVDNKTFSSNVNLYVATSGDDLQLKTPLGREGRYWNYAFKSIGAALLHAESLINLASQEPGPYKQRISYTNGPDQTFSTIQEVSLTDGNSGNPGMVAAFNLLQANKSFIQAETIAYINKKYVNKFEYDDAALRIQISQLLSDVSYDLLLGAEDPNTNIPGTNFNTYWNALSYLHNHPTNDGLIQWVAAIKFVKDQLIAFSYESTELSTYTSQIINALIYDLIFKSNYRSIQAGIAFSNAGTNINAVQLASILQVNPINIASATSNGSLVTITFATQSSNKFPIYSQVLINGVFTPKTTGGSAITLASTEVVNSVRIPKSYEVVASTVNSISFYNSDSFVSDDYTVTSGTFDRKNLINLLLLIPAVSNSITAKTSFINNSTIISDIVTTNVITNVSMPIVANPSAISGYDAVGRASARDLLLANIPFVQAETIAFLSAEFSNVTYDRDLYIRDVKYVVWSIVYDLVYSGNSQSVYAGKQFWVNLSAIERTACVAAIAHLGSLLETIAVNGTVVKQYQQSVRHYKNDTLINGSNALTSIIANIITINDILANNTNPTVTEPLVTAGVSDLQPIYTAVNTGRSAYTSGTGDFTTSWYLDHFYPVITDSNYLARIESLFSDIITTIESGIAPSTLPRYPAITVQVNRYYNAGTAQWVPIPNAWVASARNYINNLAIDNIILGVIDYLDTDYGITDADVLAILSVDLKKLIISVCYDITYGGTSASVTAALQLSIISTAAITRSVIGEASTLTRNVVNGTNVNDPTNKVSELIGTKFTAAISVFNDVDPTTDGVAIDTTLFVGDVYINAIKLRSIITDNTTPIVNDTIRYISTTFSGGFNYDESLCYRDIGLIVDAMSIDIITGGTWQSINSGKSFYKNSSAKAIAIGTHYTQSFDGLTFAKNLGLQVLNKTSSIRYQQLPQITLFLQSDVLPSDNIGVVGDYLLPVSSNAKTTFTTNMQRVLDIIQYGVSSAATPSYGSGVWNVVVDNGGKGYVDQGAPKNNDIFPAKVIVGVGCASALIEASTAYASIVKYIPGSAASSDTIQVRLTKPGFFNVGEELEFGETVRDLNLTVFIESGIYYEDYPLRIPPNVSIRGDEMRRTLLRPINRESQSPWRKIFFYRDAIIDALEVGLIDYDLNVAPAGVTATLDGVTGKIVVTLSNNYQALLSWVGKVFADNVIPNGNNKKRGKAVIDSISGNTMNCTVIYPFATAGVKLESNWFLFGTINYGRHYLTDPLDINSSAKNNKDIDVFLCNEATRIIGLTFQGHGAFAMVLDPEGNIKTKSPYIQECSSFSQSNNYKRFAGGQYIDGFAGRVYGAIKQVDDLGITVTVQGQTNSGLDIRPPQPPCSFYVRGKRYQIDDVVSFNADTQTVVLTLDKSTTYMYDAITHELVYNETKAQRDVGFVIDAAATDAILGTNYRSVHAGRAFLRSYSNLLTGALQDLTNAGITKAAELANASFSNTTFLSNNITIISSMLLNGVNATPALVWSSGTTDENKARNIIQSNKEFIKSEISAYISSTYILSNYPQYNVLTSERDVGYLVDAITYDLFYGGNSQSYDYTVAFYYRDISNNLVSVLPDEQALCSDAHDRLRVVLKQIVAGSLVSVSPGNSITQIITNPPTNAASYASSIETICQTIIGYVADPLFTLPSVIFPTLPAGVNTSAYNTVMSSIATIAADVTDFLNNGADTVINLETGGNRSMLANDFAMFNDLAYGILATNGAFTEQVCTFTYYAHTGFWANNGSNLRGVGCSNTFGNYGLRASGYDVTELPDSVTLANHMIQTARVYKQGLVINEMEPTATSPATSLWIVGYDYLPTNGAGLEIDHSANGGIITNYIITSVEYTTIQVNNQIVIKLNLSTSGDNNTASSGLATALYDGQLVSIRVLKNVKFNNIDNVKPTRPSTALQYNDNLNDVYRIVAYNLSESTGDLLGDNIAILQSDNSFTYYNFTIDPNSIINGDPSSNVSATVVSGSTSSSTLTVNNVSGTIAIGQTISGIGFAGQIVENVTGPVSGVYTITLGSVNVSLPTVPSLTPTGIITFSTKTQGYKVGDTKISVSQITQATIIDQINKGTYIAAWNGRLHRVLRYVIPTTAVTRQCTSYASLTLIVSGTARTINLGDYVVGKNGSGVITLTGTVDTVTINTSDTTVTLINATGTASNGYAITFGVTNNGYIEISSNAIINNSSDGTVVPAMIVSDSNLQPGSTVATLVTFNIPFNKYNILPKVDSVITITGNTDEYNGSYQVTGIVDQTTMQISSISGFVVGMVVTSTSAFINGAGAIIQSIDVPTNTITVSPACWIPAGSPIRATLAASVISITIDDAGDGYTLAPTITLDGGGFTQRATAVCTVVDGKITEVKVVKRGYGYITKPTVTIIPAAGTTAPTRDANLNVVLSTPVYIDTTSTVGTSVTTMTVLYPADPGVFTTNTPNTVTSNTGPIVATYTPADGIAVLGYSVTYNFATTTAPATDSWYNIEGNSNALYNGFVQVISSTTTSATVFYPYSPGTYGTGVTTITLADTSGTSSSLGISKPFSRTSAYTLKIGHAVNAGGQVTTRISTCRATGHDFCDIGTGGYSTTNIPYSIYGDPALPRNSSHETLDEGVGRCFYVSTNQDGIFRVGRFFSVDQGTGTVTFSSKISLSNIEGFGFSRGVVVNEFSSDSSMTNNAADTVPVQSAVRGYIDKRLGLDHGGSPLPFSTLIGPGFLPLNGSLTMTGDLIMGTHLITNLGEPVADADAATKGYVDGLIDNNNALSEMGDVAIVSSSLLDGQLLANNAGSWINSTLYGDVTVSYVTNLLGTRLTSAINADKIINSMVKSDAGILQSKLALTAASTRTDASGITQTNLGVASFNDKVFASSSGWIDLATASSNITGVLLSKLQYINKGTIVGNLTTGTGTGAVTTVTPGDIVTNGDGIKNEKFGSGATALTNYVMLASYNGVSTSSNTYSLVGMTTTGEISKVVQTDSIGAIDTKQLKVDGRKVIDTTDINGNVDQIQVKLTTPGNIDFIVASGGATNPTVISTVGTLDVTAGTLKSTTLTTGASTTAGSITGNWTLAGTFDTSGGSFISSGGGLLASTTRPRIKPAIMFDFANSKTLDARITFTRSTVATYFNAKGVLKTAAINQARFDHDPLSGDSKGLLVEDARTNWLSHSETFSSGYWIKSVTLLSEESTTTLAPTGTEFALQFTSSDNSARLIYDNSATPVATKYRTLSVWLKRVGGAGDISYTIDGTNYITLAITSTLVRYKLPAASTSIIKIGFQIASGDTVVIWGAQYEDGKYETSYIPTTTQPVLRAADVAVITGTNFSNWYRTDEGTFVVSHTALGIADTSTEYAAVTVQNATPTSWITIGCHPSGSTMVYNASCYTNTSTTQFTFTGFTTTLMNTLVTQAVGYSANGAAYSYNNTAVETDSIVTLPTNLDRLVIGGAGAQYIAKISYYATQLADIEIQTITTQ